VDCGEVEHDVDGHAKNALTRWAVRVSISPPWD
jgi:hypothetical protein